MGILSLTALNLIAPITNFSDGGYVLIILLKLLILNPLNKKYTLFNLRKQKQFIYRHVLKFLLFAF